MDDKTHIRLELTKAVVEGIPYPHMTKPNFAKKVGEVVSNLETVVLGSQQSAESGASKGSTNEAGQTAKRGPGRPPSDKTTQAAGNQSASGKASAGKSAEPSPLE